MWGCARLLEGSLQKSLQSLSAADRLTGAKKFLLLLPLVFFCAVRPAHAQTKYYIGGCIAETASSASVNCSPSPGIPIGSSVAVYVTFTARMPSMKENKRILAAICIGALLGAAIVFAIEMGKAIF